MPHHPVSKVALRQLKLTKQGKKVSQRGKCIPSQMAIEDIKTGKWLKDTHIRAVSTLLKAQFPSVLGLHDTTHGEDLSFPVITPPFVQILHTGNHHWLTVEGVTPSLVKVYDSLNDSTSITTQLQIASILCCEASSMYVEVQNTQFQNGGSDCGLFAVAYATDLCHGNNPASVRYYQHKLRPHLVKCLESNKMCPFPSRRCRPGKPHTEHVDVYCSCRLPEDGEEKMAACDKCGEWYHDSCEKIPIEVFKNSQASWMCSRCS